MKRKEGGSGRSVRNKVMEKIYNGFSAAFNSGQRWLSCSDEHHRAVAQDLQSPVLVSDHRGGTVRALWTPHHLHDRVS